MTDTEPGLTVEQFRHAARLATAGDQDELIKYVHAITCPRCQAPGDPPDRHRAARRAQLRARREQAEDDGIRLARRPRVADLVAETFEVNRHTATAWLRSGELVVPVAEVLPTGQPLYHLPTVRAELDRIAHPDPERDSDAT